MEKSIGTWRDETTQLNKTLIRTYVGSPRIATFEGLKKEEEDSFINTTKRIQDTHPITHFTKGRENLNESIEAKDTFMKACHNLYTCPN